MSERDEELWGISDLLRIKGELVEAEGGTTARHRAEQLFLQSIDIASRQKVLSWELRAAISLARLHRRQGRRPEAQQLLGSVYGRFSEGFETADLRKAKHLIDELS